jgi:hypothetical protein
LATAVYDIVEIELGDGTELTLRPLPIKKLRAFMELIKEIDLEENASDEDATMDVFIKAAMLCVASLSPDSPLGKDKDKFEDVVEIPTMMKILEIAGGLKLSDPNLLGAALVGTN